MQTHPPQEERPKSTSCPIQFHSDFGMFAVDQYQLTNCSIIVEASVSQRLITKITFCNLLWLSPLSLVESVLDSNSKWVFIKASAVLQAIHDLFVFT